MTWLRFFPDRGDPVSGSLQLIGGCAIALASMLGSAYVASGQAITVSKSSMGPTIDRRYSQIQPTAVNLPDQPIDARGHQTILRILVAEQGFAMRPLPRGKKGLALTANGKLAPAGEEYLSMVTEQGLSVKPGDRVILSNIKIDKNKMVFDINGGPDHKHEFMRHVQIGMGGNTAPITQDDGQQPTGSRITLTFAKYVPEVTPEQVKALLAPLISFDVKTPVQAYTDTLPPVLKEAILNHHVLVGMSTDMVLFALGQPEAKSREVEGQMPFEEWIYGHPPQDVNFVRVNGNRVIRVEVAKLGQPLEIFTKDEVAGLMTTDGKPVVQTAARDTHTIQLGDAHPDVDTHAPVAPPTLRAPGEKLPIDDPAAQGQSREGPMKPVIFPKDTTNAPARTTDAHPEKSQQPAPDSAKPQDPDNPDKADPEKAPDDKQQTVPPKPTPPSENFYSGKPQPTRF
jgi:hypothetical protein